MQTTSLPLAALRTDGGTQLRERLDPHTVREYAALMQDGTCFPAVVVFHDGEHHWLADGYHRVEAARQAGLQEIAADIRPGTRREAVLFAAGANAAHGLRRSNADKRRAVLLLLQDEEWSAWSDREIGRKTGVHHTTVSSLRRELSGGISQTARQVQRGGTVFTLNTAHIGKTSVTTEVDRAVELPAEPPAPVAEMTSAPPAEPEGNGPEGWRERLLRVRQLLAQPAGTAARVQSGEWWRLGSHRLYRGLATAPQFEKSLPPASLAVLQPGTMPPTGSLPWLPGRAECLAVLPPPDRLAESLHEVMLPFRGTTLAVREPDPTARRLGHPSWHVVLLFALEELRRAKDELWRLPPASTALEAECQLLAELLARRTGPGEVVLAPHLGEGTLLLLAEVAGRSCWGAVSDPAAAARIVGRWEELTQQKAQFCPLGRL